MKNTIILTLIFCGYAQIYSQNTLIISANTLKMTGSTDLMLKNTQLINNGTFEAGAGTVHITGNASDSQSAIDGTSTTTFYNLAMEKSTNGSQLNQIIQIENELQMTSGHLDLNNNNLLLGNANGTIVGESAASYIHGSTGGEIIKTVDLNAPTSENPGNIGVEITSTANLGSTTIKRGHQAQTIYGTASTKRYYDISPATNDGLDATLRFHYLDVELNSIPEVDLEAVRNVNPSWHYYAVNTADQAANYVQVSNVNAFSTWTLAKGEIKLSPKVFLQGPYANSGLMDDGLRSGSLLPSTEPYTALTAFTHVNNGGNEKADDLLFTKTGDDAIVDWIFVELRDKNDNTLVLHTRAALIQKDGDIVGLNGKDPVSFPAAAADNYFITLRHRNHIGVMSNSTIALSIIDNVYDFSTSASNTLGTANGIFDLGDGFFGLFSGDFDVNGQVQNTDVNAMIQEIGTSGYISSDMDMNGQAQNTDLQLKLMPNIGRGAQFGY